MANDANDIILKPAKRILVLYLLVFLATIGVLGLVLQHFGQRLGVETRILMYLWNTIVVIGGGLLCYAVLWRFTCSYRLTNQCVTGSTGILSRQHIRIALNQIVDYRIVRPLLERLIGLGNLNIDTAGRDGDELIMNQISLLELEKAVLRLDVLLDRDQHKSEKAVKMAQSS